MCRSLTPPSVEEKPYPIKDGPLKELACKKFNKLHKEKRFEGPYPIKDKPKDVHLTSVFVKEKDLSKNKVLVLSDYSSPKGNSINSAIPKEAAYVPFPTLLFFIQWLMTFGPLALIWVADLADAYYQVWIKAMYRKLFGMQFVGRYMLPYYMPFGIATATLEQATEFGVVDGGVVLEVKGKFWD